jgi:hypothetical protein
MSSALALALPNFALPFILEIDALGSGLGAVLMQQRKPIAYYSQALGPKNFHSVHLSQRSLSNSSSPQEMETLFDRRPTYY